MECKFCGKLWNSARSLRSHEQRCKANPDYIVKPKTDCCCQDRLNRKRKGSNQYTKAKELGLPKPEISEETRQRLSRSAKLQNSIQWTEERRVKHSLSMQRAVRENPDSYSKNNVCGRVRVVEYCGVKLKGSWELKVAMWLDSHSVLWESEPKPHSYFWNNGWHLYFPDFYLQEYDVFIEVKGFRRDRDVAKWTQFQPRLVIIDKSVIDSLSKYSDILQLIESNTFQLPIV